MNIALFITLITVFSAITSLFTECAKKLLNERHLSYSSNIITFVIACVVGIGGTGIYYTLNGIPFTGSNIVCMLLMGLAVSVGATVGYDKVIQTIAQFKSNTIKGDDIDE